MYDEVVSGRLFAYNLRFPGQYYDVETGKHYNYYRDYGASIGRYIQSDPIGLFAGTNTYSYVRSNPLSTTDPTGLLDSGKGGGGGRGGSGGATPLMCPLTKEIFIGFLWLIGPMVVSQWMCVYDCNLSCPGDESKIIIQIQTTVTPPLRYGCDRSIVRPFPLGTP